MGKRLSVVVATYNRGALLVDLLRDLAAQTLPAADFEVVIVDDGSVPPAAQFVDAAAFPFKLRLVTQKNAGPAAARHHGVQLAEGDIVVITDDDMRLPDDFLAAHLAAHEAGATVVLGNICAAPGLAQMPIFERFHAHQLERFVEGVRAGRVRVRGVHVCTGNLSLRRADYLRVGGFDQALGRSEDRELGVRLEKHGAKLAFAEAAKTVHGSDHADLDVWLRRGFHYGVFDRRISQKHPDVEDADPWRFYFLISPLSRPLMLLPIVAPGLGDRAARLAMAAAMAGDRLGLTKLALAGTTLVYGLEYYRGVRQDAGSLRQVARDVAGYLRKRGRAGEGRGGGGGGRRRAVRRFVGAVRGDYANLQRYRAKYHAEAISLRRLPADLVRKVGFQTATMVRLMQLGRDLRLPLAPMVVSRLIRHLYGAEIHWDARIAPGLSIVHGVGLVISHAASISEGCILFHNVTLGEGVDPLTRKVGAPSLGRDVHVGPGATLIGPIEVGAGTKIMAGAVLTQSVPPNSLVRPADAHIGSRGGRGGRGGRGDP